MCGLYISFYPHIKKGKRGFKAGIRRVTKKTILPERVKAKIKKSIIIKEILGSSICLKNLAIIKTSESMSTDYVIEQLTENAHRLKPYYMKTLSLYRSGYRNEAYEYLENVTEDKQMKNLVTVLRKLDNMKAEDLIEQIDSFNECLMEERTTLNRKRAERNALIFTVLVSVNIFALLLNFSVVVIFMDAINMLKTMW